MFRRFMFVLLLLCGCGVDLFDPLGKGSYEYDTRLPTSYGNSTRQWPVLVFLHGAGGLPRNYIADYAAHADSFPFVLITPHTNYQWETERLNNVLDEVLGKYRTDRRRVYVTGFSMGAHGTFDWAAAAPSRIAAAIMIAGAGPTGGGCAIKDVPAWFIHNLNDPIVPTSETQRTVAELQGCGVSPLVQINDEPGAVGTHDAWTAFYAAGNTYSWLLTHSR